MYAELKILCPECGAMNTVNIDPSTLVQTAFCKECEARAGGQNVQDLKNFYVEGGKSFRIAPANDQYTFTFDNKGMSDCTVEFTLTEVWTGSLSPLIWVLGQAGLLMVPIGSGILAYIHYANNRETA